MRSKVESEWKELNEAIDDLRDENGEVDLDEFHDRLESLGLRTYPISIHWDDLDYNSSETAEINLTLRYEQTSCIPTPK